MRVACIYLPSFPLQVHVRRAPHLAGRSFAVVGGAVPAVIVCSRSAWNAGVRPGMSAAQARAACDHVQLLPAEPQLYRDALEALADSLLVHTGVVDIAGRELGDMLQPHQVVYLDAAPTARGSSFGQKLLVQLSRQGFRGRVGIADDKFAAWAAATTVRNQPAGHRADDDSPLFSQSCTTVPRGGSAPFLAPLSLNLLPLEANVIELLGHLGVRTLGEFAALPPPSVGRTGSGLLEADYQKLARGDGPAALVPYQPVGSLVETIELARPVEYLEPLSFILRPLGDRVCERLRGRGRAAHDLVLRLWHPDRQTVTEVPIAPGTPSLAAVSLVEAARRQLARVRVEHPVSLVELEVTREVEPDDGELNLFATTGAGSNEVDRAIARLERSFGADGGDRPAWFGASESHRRTRRGKQRRRRPGGTSEQAVAAQGGRWPQQLRLLDAPAIQPPGLRTIEASGAAADRSGAAPVQAIAAEGSGPVGRDAYQVETDDGGRHWVFRQADGRYYLHGIFD